MNSKVEKDLSKQVWYWPHANHQTVYNALNEQSDGSFIVRKANPGSDHVFVLSLKFEARVQKFRIYVNNERCEIDSDFAQESVVKLIEFYGQTSLITFNKDLDVKLLYPMINFQEQTMVFNVQNENDWKDNLELEKLRAINISFERAAKLYHKANQGMEKVERLNKEIDQFVRTNNNKLESLRDLLTVTKKLVSTQGMPREEMLHINEFVNTSISRITEEIIDSLEVKKDLEENSVDFALKKSLAESWLYDFMARQNASVKTLDLALTDRIAAIFAFSKEMVLGEADEVTELLVDIKLEWTPEQWFMFPKSDKSDEEYLFRMRSHIAEHNKKQGAKKRSMDGIFLVKTRPSNPDKFLLSVLYGERVIRCLIVETNNGWGFQNSNVRMPTVTDLIRYYSHFDLESDMYIKTVLETPAFANFGG